MSQRSLFPTSFVFLISSAIFAVSILLNGCALFGSKKSGVALSSEDWQVHPGEPLTTLESYYARYVDLPRRADLIACAAGGQRAMTGSALEPVSVFFYPKDNARDVRIFEAKSILSDTLDFADYQEVRWPVEPVFNGYLRRYATEYLKRETWLVITCLTNDTLHTSGMIHLKVAKQPTMLDVTEVSSKAEFTGLRFQWPGDSTVSSSPSDSADKISQDAQDAIYFEVVSELSGDLISGTYTHEPHFTFYDTENVVINIRDINPPPSLISGKKYNFMVMAVSQDNWVNRILRMEFVAP